MENVFDRSIQVKYFAFATGSTGLLFGSVNGADPFFLKIFFIIMGILIFTITPYTMFIAKYYTKSHIKIGVLVFVTYLIALVIHSVYLSIVLILMFFTIMVFYSNKLNEKIEVDEHHTPLKLIWSNKKFFRLDFIMVMFFIYSTLAAMLL